MNDQTPRCSKATIHACDFRQNAGGNHDRQGGDAADETGDRAPSQRTEDVKAGTLHLPVERIGLNEQPNPNLVNRRIRDTENQTIEDVSDERTEYSPSLFCRPIERHSPSKPQKCQWAKKPPEDSEPEPPPHARAVGAHVSLEKETKADADQQGDGKMQGSGHTP